jgi:hypothetical protein
MSVSTIQLAKAAGAAARGGPAAEHVHYILMFIIF